MMSEAPRSIAFLTRSQMIGYSSVRSQPASTIASARSTSAIEPSNPQGARAAGCGCAVSVRKSMWFVPTMPRNRRSSR